MLTGIPCTLMRGGTSKGLYFHASDLPDERALRDRVLLAAMGSPDVRQIDGVGGAHPLTSKVAVISRSTRPDADVETFAPVREQGYTLLHLTARYQISKGLFVAARLENAFDEEYRLVNGFNTAPRGVFVTAGWQP